MTIEGLFKGWPDYRAAFGLFTCEGAMFMAGHGMNDDNRLKTSATLSDVWNGQPIKRIRVSDVTLLVGRRLCMHVMVQPHNAHEFLANGALRDQGILSRILVAEPDSLAGSRPYKEKEFEETKAIGAYGARLLSILETPPALAPGKRNELDPPAIPFSDAALQKWIVFHDHIEKQLGGNDDDLTPIKDFACKAAENAARIAGVLTIIDDQHACEIGLDAMENAIDLMDWYVGEVLRLRQSVNVNLELKRALILLEWIRARGGEVLFLHILQYGPRSARVKNKKDAEEVIAILREHSLIFETDPPRTIRLVEKIGLLRTERVARK